MTDTISITGFVASDPKVIVTSEGLNITSFRLASNQRRYSKAQNAWVDGDTNWYTVSCFRQLAVNAAGSVQRGERVVVAGRLRIREWQSGEKAGISIEIEADALGHDLAWGTASYTRNVTSKQRRADSDTFAPADSTTGAADDSGSADSAGSSTAGEPNPSAEVADAEAQTREWEEHKRRERAARGETDDSALAGISAGMPEWMRAVKLQNRAARTGFDWPGPDPVIEKLHEEIEEVRAELDAVAARPGDAAARDRLEEEVGDLLFVAANLARHARVDVGSALRRANLKFERRFRAMEALATEEGTSLADLPLRAHEAYWARVKSGEGTEQ